MDKEKNTALEAQGSEEITEAEKMITEAAEETVEEIAEAAEETVEVIAEAAEEAAEVTEAAEEAAEVTEAAEEAAEVTETAEEAAEAAEPAKVSSKRLKKIERREAKAARKAANKIEEKKSRPNNALIAVLIFGVVIAMFAFVLGYNYFSKPATIEKYLEKNGGEEVYGSMQVDELTTAKITAKGNSMTVEMTIDGSNKEAAELAKEYYTGENGEKQLKNISAYFLTGTKPETRAFSADIKTTVKLGDEELSSVEMTYKEAKKFLEDAQKEAEEAAEAEDNGEADADAGTDSGAEAADDSGASEETEEAEE